MPICYTPIAPLERRPEEKDAGDYEVKQEAEYVNCGGKKGPVAMAGSIRNRLKSIGMIVPIVAAIIILMQIANETTAHVRRWLGYVYPSRAGLAASNLDKSSKRFINPKFSHVVAENDRPIPARSSLRQLQVHEAKRTDHAVHAPIA